MGLFDTVAAVSTPRGFGGIAVIRISGDRAIEIAGRIFEAKKPLSETESNKAVWGKIYLTETGGEKRCVDDGIAVVFRAPRSFTGEDTVEISCHGGVLVTDTVLRAAFAAGAAPAGAGEFTRRAFVNGKLSLTEAEALSSLLTAVTDDQLKLARGGMSGALSNEIEAIYTELLSVSTAIRAKIDFPEEDLAELTDAEIDSALRSALDKINSLAKTYKTGKAVAVGVPTVICGGTNAGKSSLYNRMVGEDAAIVTEIEGTTRDIISETVAFGGVTLRLFDTAGLRDTEDRVEAIGVEKAKDAIKKAELIIAVFDGSKPLSDQDLFNISEIEKSRAKVIAVINKNDLSRHPDAEKIKEKFPDTVELSAKDGQGIDKLEKAISQAFLDEEIDLSNDAVIANERQYGALSEASGILREALCALELGVPIDAVCSDIERAMETVAGVDGREVGEDIVASIFSKFCVGK